MYALDPTTGAVQHDSGTSLRPYVALLACTTSTTRPPPSWAIAVLRPRVGATLCGPAARRGRRDMSISLDTRRDAERLRDFAAVALADGRPGMSDQLRAIADRVEQLGCQLDAGRPSADLPVS